MDTTSSNQRKLVDERVRERVEHLLSRYPDIGSEETAEILRFLKKGPALEVGLLSSDEAVKPKLERFRADHAKAFTLGPKEYAVTALIIAAIVVVGLLLSDIGGR